MAAQDTLLSAVDTPQVEQAALPVIEYTMQRKTYEIAGIEVTGAESYEDFVLIGFSGLAVARVYRGRVLSCHSGLST